MAYRYKVQKGDTPLTIANRYNLTPQQVLQANSGGAPFSTGQTIKLPKPAAPNQYLDEQLWNWLKGAPTPTQLNTAITSFSPNKPGRGYYRPQPTQTIQQAKPAPVYQQSPYTTRYPAQYGSTAFQNKGGTQLTPSGKAGETGFTGPVTQADLTNSVLDTLAKGNMPLSGMSPEMLASIKARTGQDLSQYYDAQGNYNGMQTQGNSDFANTPVGGYYERPGGGGIVQKAYYGVHGDKWRTKNGVTYSVVRGDKKLKGHTNANENRKGGKAQSAPAPATGGNAPVGLVSWNARTG